MVKTQLPPGPQDMPVVGNILQFRRDPLAFVSGVQRSFGRLATIHMGRAPIVLFFRPEHVRYFLVDGGTTVMFSQWVLHRLPDIWGDPDAFRPERWDPSRGEKIPAGAYFPFGGGPRVTLRPQYGIQMVLEPAAASPVVGARQRGAPAVEGGTSRRSMGG